MELSIIANYLLQDNNHRVVRNLEDVSGFLSAAGFKHVDYTSDFISDNYIEKAEKDRETLEKCGIKVEQTHAPFNRYQQFDEDMFFTYFGRVFEISKILNAKYVVVHADEYKTRDKYDEKEILDFTCKYLDPFVEYAAKYGMTVAVENVFEDNSYRYSIIDGKSRFTSRVEELLAVIEKFNTPNVACCWDFGHAKCAYGRDCMIDALKQVGKYVVCTHVHDNYFDKDLHLVPFLGDTDWKENMSVLNRAGYKGKLSFEFAYGDLPMKLLPTWLNYVYETGKTLVEYFDNN